MGHAEGMRAGRSIPAYAGDPGLGYERTTIGQVYPRLRGGSCGSLANRIAGRGLSPPTRGIRPSIAGCLSHLRSIPAYAGDPITRSKPYSRTAVYPRLRGGSGIKVAVVIPHEGLSPPTRGIPSRLFLRHSPLRSIPAYAGDPRA